MIICSCKKNSALFLKDNEFRRGINWRMLLKIEDPACPESEIETVCSFSFLKRKFWTFFGYIFIAMQETFYMKKILQSDGTILTGSGFVRLGYPVYYDVSAI